MRLVDCGHLVGCRRVAVAVALLSTAAAGGEQGEGEYGDDGHFGKVGHLGSFLAASRWVRA